MSEAEYEAMGPAIRDAFADLRERLATETGRPVEDFELDPEEMDAWVEDHPLADE